MKVADSFLEKIKIAVSGLIEGLRADLLETKAVNKSYLLTVCYAGQPRDTVIVQDVSWSMGISDYLPTRLAGGIQAAIEYINTRAEHCPNDRIAVVSFSHTARVVVALSSIAAKEKIIKAVRRLSAGGGTDIAEGLKKASEIFQDQLVCTNDRQIILLTDGHGGHPVGMANRLKDKCNVVIDVVGIGGSPCDVNVSLLRKVATTDPDGLNHYRFIRDSKALKEHYKQLATGLVWRGEDK
jgi:uncharacterized protein YegL